MFKQNKRFVCRRRQSDNSITIWTISMQRKIIFNFLLINLLEIYIHIFAPYHIALRVAEFYANFLHYTCR